MICAKDTSDSTVSLHAILCGFDTPAEYYKYIFTSLHIYLQTERERKTDRQKEEDGEKERAGTKIEPIFY